MTDVNTSELLSGQMGLSGLQTLLLGSQSRHILRQELKALLTDGSKLGPCYLRRAKLRIGRKLTACYDVVIHSDITTVRPISVTWTSDGSAFESETGSRRQLEDLALTTGVAAPFRSLSSIEQKCGLHVQVSPLDIAFPQLVRLVDPSYAEAMLSKVQVGAGVASEQFRPNIRFVRYRPGERHVLEYSNPGGGEGASLFAKLYRGGQAAQAFAWANRSAEWLGAAGAGISSNTPFAVIEESSVVLYPRVPGVPLSGYPRQPAHRYGDHLFAIGCGLRSLHRMPVPPLIALPHRTFLEKVNVISRSSQNFAVLLPAAFRRVHDLLKHAVELHAALPNQEPTFTHGDFKADHIWVGPHGLTLIDFDTCQIADPAADIGKFLADLQWWLSDYRQTYVQEAQERFLSGYGTTREQLNRARVYESVLLMKMALRRVRLFDRDWHSRISYFVSLAESVLLGLEHRVWASTPTPMPFGRSAPV